jgi:hypothetical protein
MIYSYIFQVEIHGGHVIVCLFILIKINEKIECFIKTMNDYYENSDMTTPETTTTSSQTEQGKSKPAVDPVAALEFGKIQHTYRPIPQGFMGYGSSGAWD